MINKIKRNQFYQILIQPVAPYLSGLICVPVVLFIVLTSWSSNYSFKSRQVSCMSNLKQIGLALYQKTQQLFSKSNWFQRLTHGSPAAEFPR